jgi:uncharacterized RmlC-like cupin family protein
MSTLQRGPLGIESGMTQQIVDWLQAPTVAGRRGFFEYRDLGMAAATGGRMDVQLITSSQGMARPTGWHYHVCEMQVGFVLEGWVDLQFEDGTERRAEANEMIFIPGGYRHNEVGLSTRLKVLELSVPSDMGTVACPPPNAGSSTRSHEEQNVGSDASAAESPDPV